MLSPGFVPTDQNIRKQYFLAHSNVVTAVLTVKLFLPNHLPTAMCFVKAGGFMQI